VAVSSQRPNVEALVRCARLFAQSLSVSPLPDARARAVVDDVLFGRKDAWAGFTMGIITREEVTNLLLAHLHTELVSGLARYPEGEPWKRPELRDAFEKALFDS